MNNVRTIGVMIVFGLRWSPLGTVAPKSISSQDNEDEDEAEGSDISIFMDDGSGTVSDCYGLR